MKGWGRRGILKSEAYEGGQGEKKDQGVGKKGNLRGAAYEGGRVGKKTRGWGNKQVLTRPSLDKRQ